MNISKIIINIALCGFVSLSYSTHRDCYDLFAGSMLAAGIGDALGRVTEHTDSTDAIFKKYPLGVRTYLDFKPQDWERLPLWFKNNKIAPYTDDTGMARLVMKELIKSKEHRWDLNQTMSAMAESFVSDFNDELGWAARFRAVGRACVAGTQELEKRLSAKKYAQLFPRWWDIEANDAGGCGSVMRAHPFGLVFSKNPKKAALWATEHSKLTHGNPIALAACAAMATGVAYAVQRKSPDYIVEQMITAADKYDHGTALKITQAREFAHQARMLKNDLYVFQAYKNTVFRAFNDKVFTTFPGWAAHDAIAATAYALILSPDNLMEAIYLGVHTSGDSDSIASMAGALVGARLGAKSLPIDLVEQLENSEDLKADALKAARIAKNCD